MRIPVLYYIDKCVEKPWLLRFFQYFTGSDCAFPSGQIDHNLTRSHSDDVTILPAGETGLARERAPFFNAPFFVPPRPFLSVLCCL